MQFVKYGSKIFGLSYSRKRIYLYHNIFKESPKKAHTMSFQHLNPVNVSNAHRRTQFEGSAVLTLQVYFL
jgi:hypothetical protein